MAWGRARRAGWGEGGLAGQGIDAALRAPRTGAAADCAFLHAGRAAIAIRMKTPAERTAALRRRAAMTANPATAATLRRLAAETETITFHGPTIWHV